MNINVFYLSVYWTPFINILKFSVYMIFASLFKFIPKYLLFDDFINDIKKILFVLLIISV